MRMLAKQANETTYTFFPKQWGFDGTRDQVKSRSNFSILVFSYIFLLHDRLSMQLSSWNLASRGSVKILGIFIIARLRTSPTTIAQSNCMFSGAQDGALYNAKYLIYMYICNGKCLMRVILLWCSLPQYMLQITSAISNTTNCCKWNLVISLCLKQPFLIKSIALR